MTQEIGPWILVATVLLIGMLFAIFNRPNKQLSKSTMNDVTIKKRDSNTLIKTKLEVREDKSYILPELKEKFETPIAFFKKYKIIEVSKKV